MTSILQLPLLQVAIETATNEDWRDGIAFATASEAEMYAAPGNTGTATLTALSVQPGASVGVHAVAMSDAANFQVSDPDGFVLGSGVVGVPFSRSGLSFTLQSSGAAFVGGDTLYIAVLPGPIDLTGLTFRLQIRTAPEQTRLFMDVSTAAGTIINGGVSGVLGLSVESAVMSGLPPGAYVFDIVASGDGVDRRCVTGTINHVTGVTRAAA